MKGGRCTSYGTPKVGSMVGKMTVKYKKNHTRCLRCCTRHRWRSWNRISSCFTSAQVVPSSFNLCGCIMETSLMHLDLSSCPVALRRTGSNIWEANAGLSLHVSPGATSLLLGNKQVDYHSVTSVKYLWTQRTDYLPNWPLSGQSPVLALAQKCLLAFLKLNLFVWGEVSWLWKKNRKLTCKALCKPFPKYTHALRLHFSPSQGHRITNDINGSFSQTMKGA